ncbi:MAG: hypothetical protein SFV19_09335 [Rhodospirillaceae bacterium]|nr:hypothetical protein [Rhodospirillaceae bacterium]
MANTMSISKPGTIASARAPGQAKPHLTPEFWAAAINVIATAGAIAVTAAVALALLGSLASMV